MGTRLKVLQTFKALHRTRMTVFKDDAKALIDRFQKDYCPAMEKRLSLTLSHPNTDAARLKINDEFKKNKNEISEENIQQMIKMGRSVETVLRENILQAELVGENKLVLRPRENHLLENVPYCDSPRKQA